MYETLYISKKDRFELSSSSKGNQVKWTKGNLLFIKADTMGYLILQPY